MQALPRLINEASFHITAFARLLNMWLGVVATRIESGEGTLLSSAQAWNSKHVKFPFEFLEFNDAIEADITELFELYYQDIEEKNNNPELTTCSTDSSSSDDDEPCDYDLTNEAMELYDDHHHPRHSCPLPRRSTPGVVFFIHKRES